MCKPLIILIVSAVCARGCYWNAQCPYQLYGSKTPYDTVRGDLRDFATPANCQAVSIWTLNRHGNRYPGRTVTEGMRQMALLKDEIIASYNAGTSQLCAQTVDHFKDWTWNTTLEVSPLFLTGTGSEELYGIGKRIREKYSHLLQGTAEQFYFRPTNEQRTVASCAAFVHGFTEGLNLSVTVDPPRERDDVVRPFQNCERYQVTVRRGPTVANQLDTYFSSPAYIAIQNSVQQRLGISTQLTPENVLSFYELCRFYRSWTPDLKSPWCAVFSDQDLVVLEYYDDVRDFYRNGYGSWVNENLGRLPLRDLYENLEAAVQGSGRKVVSYFSHDTMMEMVLSALGMYRETSPLNSLVMNPDRVWRTSYIGAFASNLIAVLNSCTESGNQTYRVQLFFNEKETSICPLEGCTWQEFQNIFKPNTSRTGDLDFCRMDYVNEVIQAPSTNRASSTRSL